MLKRYLLRMFENSVRDNKQNILRLITRARGTKFLDLGCDDGAWTKQVSIASKASTVHGIEIVPERARLARDRGVEVEIANLDEALPYPDASFDVVHSNQVIEHVADVDNFASEIKRVLKPGGVAVVSTENGSSWHNIAAAILGWQIFSLTNVSKKKAGLGNPLSLLRGHDIDLGSWTHKVIFNYRGLREFFELHGFEVLALTGAGYHPLPSWLGRLDVRHSHWLTIAVKKVG